MTLQPWKRLNEERVNGNSWWEYWKADYRHPNGELVTYHEVRSLGFSIIVPVRDDGRVLLLRMYRPVPEAFTLEFPAGGREADESFKEAARRELVEEADLEAGVLEEVGQAIQDVGRSNARFATFIAHGLTKKTGEKDPTEEFEPQWVTVKDLDQLIQTGKILDAHTITAWAQAKRRVLELVDSKS